MECAEVVQLLELEPHPREGGWFKEIYRSQEHIPAGGLADRYSGPRATSTLIYYLITPERYSLFHRVKSDEIFHFYLGDAASLCTIDGDNGNFESIVLGKDITRGQNLYSVVRHRCWQAVTLIPGGKWALLAATVSPGFDYQDFDEPDRDYLLRLCPEHSALITRLTRPASDITSIS